jgi:hypothetical protein
MNRSWYNKLMKNINKGVIWAKALKQPRLHYLCQVIFKMKSD